MTAPVTAQNNPIETNLFLAGAVMTTISACLLYGAYTDPTLEMRLNHITRTSIYALTATGVVSSVSTLRRTLTNPRLDTTQRVARLFAIGSGYLLSGTVSALTFFWSIHEN